MFQDWKEKIKQYPNVTVSKHLLWEFDLSNFDWQDMKTLVVQRVIERGRVNDFYAIFKMYGGKRGVKNIIKKIPQFSNQRDLAFVLSVFNLKKEELECYTRKQSRERHFRS